MAMLEGVFYNAMVSFTRKVQWQQNICACGVAGLDDGVKGCNGECEGYRESDLACVLMLRPPSYSRRDFLPRDYPHEPTYAPDGNTMISLSLASRRRTRPASTAQSSTATTAALNI